MQAILTKILPATDTKPTRIKAICSRGSAIISYPDCDTTEQAHIWAANNLVHLFANDDYRKNKTPFNQNAWLDDRASGQLASGDYVHVFTK